MNAVGLAVTLRVRMSVADAHQSSGVVNPARILSLLADVASELMIRHDGDEGSLRGLDQVEMLAPVFVGDFIEATGVLTKVGSSSRQVAFEARKVATYVHSDELAPTAADALAVPTIVCRAVGTAIVPRSQQRKPKIVLPALGAPKDLTRLPQGNVIITPPPRVIVTPPRQTPPEVMIAASIVGGGVTKAHTPHIPQTPAEVANEARRCAEAGACIAFLGVDNAQADPALLQSRMAETVAAIRNETDIIIVVSPTRPGLADISSFIAFADCGADIVSIPLGSFNLGDGVVDARRTVVRAATTSLRERESHVMGAVFELGHYEEALQLLREKAIVPPLKLQFTFGVPGAIGANESLIQYIAERIPKNTIWFAAGVGRHQRRVTETAMTLGGHVRLGLADNIYLRRGVFAESTTTFIERSVSFAVAMGRQPAAVDRARALLGLDSPTISATTINSDTVEIPVEDDLDS